MKQALIYSLKVWLTTVVLGMRVTGLIRIVMGSNHQIYHPKDIISSAMYDIPIGLIACLPSWLLFSIATYYVSLGHSSIRNKRLWLTLIALLLSLLPFAMVFWHQLTNVNYLPDMLPMLIAYGGVTISSVWFYKLKPVKESKLPLEV